MHRSICIDISTSNNPYLALAKQPSQPNHVLAEVPRTPYSPLKLALTTDPKDLKIES